MWLILSVLKRNLPVSNILKFLFTYKPQKSLFINHIDNSPMTYSVKKQSSAGIKNEDKENLIYKEQMGCCFEAQISDLRLIPEFSYIQTRI